MTKKFLWLALILSLVWVGAAYAQDADDDAADDDVAASFADSSVTFTAPDALEANTEITFEFQVFNAAPVPEGDDAGIGIKQVDLVLPSADYVYADEQPAAPMPLHPDKVAKWEVSFDSANQTITWQTFGVVSTEEFGDIREQDVLTFSFVATTDGGPTDGFAWTLYGDDTAGSTVSGTWFFGDDDTTDDDIVDDDTVPDDDNDDNNDSGGGGGCGC